MSEPHTRISPRVDHVATRALTVDFVGESFVPDPDAVFSIGREGDLVVDENPYLHRRLLTLHREQEMWWLSNTGQTISVSLSTGDGTYQAVLGPGARVPVLFPRLVLLFTAGPFTYELEIRNPHASFVSSVAAPADSDGDETIGGVTLTPAQKLLLLALAEPLLRDGVVGSSQIPSSAQAAERLGWPLTTFNRKLDNVCDKLARQGVQGLRGGAGRLATNRRARLVEHAVLSRLVVPEDLPLLELAQQEAAQDASANAIPTTSGGAGVS